MTTLTEPTREPPFCAAVDSGQSPADATDAKVIWQTWARQGTSAIWGTEMTQAFRTIWIAGRVDSGSARELRQAA